MFGFTRHAIKPFQIRRAIACKISLPWTSRISPYLLGSRSRPFSTSHIDPSVRQFASSLARLQPCFSMAPDDIQILAEPREFYQTLLKMIGKAQKRIFISSLYIGSGEHELISALRSALASNPELHVYLQLDLNRSTRPGPSSTAHLLMPLIREFPDRVHVSLFRSPKLKGIMAKLVPPRFNEGWGTWHAKIYGADDEVIISGANLNESYFTNRQDRYIHFLSQPKLAEYCFYFLETVSTFSYKLLPLPGPSKSEQQYILHWPDPDTHPHEFESKAHQGFTSLQQKFLCHSAKETSASEGENNVLVLPIIQGGQFNIHEEKRCISLLYDYLALLKRTEKFRPVVDLTSGYFSLFKVYQDLVLRSLIPTRIVIASPLANGFFGSSGISGRIPEGYTFLEQRFMKAVSAANRMWGSTSPGIELSEWERHGWTYHAKGIWVSPTPDEAPVLTLFGSSNLNSRSANLDTELSFVLITSSPRLREKLHEEVERLRRHTSRWKGGERKVRWGTKLIVGLVGGML